MKYIFYVNIGKLPKRQADQYIKSVILSEQIKKFFEPEDKVLYVPIRNHDSYLHIINEKTGTDIDLSQFKPDELEYLHEILNYLKA